ncbi:MAG: thiol peroxidase [bacterium]|nr:thiol peroxidase [bacterium]
MAKITLKGSPFNTTGELPKVGSKASDFTMSKKDLSKARLSQYLGKKVILNIFPSIDTPVCATSVRKFNAELANKPNTVVLCISMDLPFAASRFCGAEGIENVEILSNFRGSNFGEDYGVAIIDGPLEGLFARSVVVIDEKGTINYTELVSEIAQEPNYTSAFNAV